MGEADKRRCNAGAFIFVELKVPIPYFKKQTTVIDFL